MPRWTAARSCLLLALLTLVLQTACGPSTAAPGVGVAGAAQGGEAAGESRVVVALTSEPQNLNPIFLDINAGNWPIFNGLIKFDAALQPVPDLAAELPEVSDDLRTVTVRLRDGVRFHDGIPLTADDVVFTWQAIMRPEVASPVRSVMAVDIEDVQALDERTVQFRLSRPDPAFVEKLYVGIVPRHLLELEDLNRTRFNREPIGTGPYKLAEWREGDRMILEANLDYFEGRPAIDGIVFTFVGDDNARSALLSNGTIDYTRVPPRLAASFNGDTRFQVIDVPSASVYQISLPNDHPVLGDATVRRALAMAIDRNAIVEQILGGMGGPAYGPMQPGHWAYDAESVVPFDPAAARALLESAGWRDSDGDGFLEKDGERLAFTLIYLANNSEDRQMALAIRSDLARLGADVSVDGVQSPAHQDRLGHDAWLHGIGLPYDPDYILWSRYHSQYADDSDPSTNPARMRNAQVDAALEAGRATRDREQRRAAYVQLQRALLEDGSYLHIAQRPVVVVVSSKISGIEPQLMGSPHAFVRGLFYNVAQWRMEP